MERKHGHHAAGFSFFGAIGIVATQITRSAHAGVVYVLNACRATLPNDFRSEIHIVVRRADARTELHDHLRRIGSEAFNHLFDRVWDNAKLGAFAAGMHKTNCRCRWINDVNCATVCDVNAERDTGLIGDNAIARREFADWQERRSAARRPYLVDYCDLIPMDLFGGE